MRHAGAASMLTIALSSLLLIDTSSSSSPAAAQAGACGPGAAVELARCDVGSSGRQRLRRRPDGRLALGDAGLCVAPAARSGIGSGGGGGSGGGACASDHDCQLNGVCTEGRCDCDAAWQGERCQDLALSGDGALAYGGPDSMITSWGGGPPALDAASGRWTLFVTEIADHCGLSEWGSQSTVVAATAASPAGPFVRQKLAIDYQAHNPYYAFDASTRTHLIFHIGDGRHGGGQPRHCTNGTTPNGSSTASLAARLRQGEEGMCPCACGPCGSWVHHAPSLAGPWTRLAVPFNTKNKTSGGPGEGFVMDNPAPYVFPNGEPPRYRWHLGCILPRVPAISLRTGTVLLLTRKINWCSMHKNCDQPRPITEIWLAKAPSYDSLYN